MVGPFESGGVLENAPLFMYLVRAIIVRGTYTESPMSICFVAVDLSCFMSSYVMDGKTHSRSAEWTEILQVPRGSTTPRGEDS